MSSLDLSISGKQRRLLARRRQILDTALDIAEAEGWHAVTTRRLANAIGYSQPIIYQHFTNRDELIRAIAVEGFEALSNRITVVAQSASGTPLEDLARSYIDFGTAHPRLYEVMFTQASELPFAESQTPPELRSAFDALTTMIGREATGAAEATAELYWACCHGLVTLLDAGRIPPTRLEHHIGRIADLARRPHA